MSSLFVPALFACLIAAFGTVNRTVAEEPHVAGVIAAISESVARLKAADPDAVPMAFWDFDGTIIKGDIGYGFTDADGNGYPSIIEHTIRAGFSSVYSGEDGFRAWGRDYARMEQIGHWLSHSFDAQMYVGADAAALDASCTRWIAEKGISKWYFASSVAIWKALEKIGVENYVVSANIEPLVRNAAPSLGIPRGRVRATRVLETGGRLTTHLVYPIPYGEGKVEAVRELVLARPRGVAVAGFGNSYSTDGNFLRFIVGQKLPGGARPLSMMINGGAEPAKYKDLFLLVKQSETVGDVERAGTAAANP